MDDNFYAQFCKERFQTLEANQGIMTTELTEIKVRLFNGFGDTIIATQKDIAEMKKWREGWNRSKARFARDVLLMLLGAGGVASYVLPLIFKG